MDVNFIKNIAAHISSVPPLPAAAQKLIQLTSGQEVDIKEVSQVISMDMAIASKLLQIVNSPFYGLRQKINTIPQAITLMGLDAIKSMALSISVIKSSSDQKGAPYLTQEEFWRHSLSTAILCKKLSTLLGYTDPEEAFIAGLMHDIGKLVLLEFSGDSYIIALRQASKGKASLNSLESEIFEMNHALLGAELCRHWMIPEKISSAIASHHEPLFKKDPQPEEELGNIISVGNQLAHILDLGASGNHLVSLDTLRFLIKKKLNLTEILNIIESATKEINDSGKYFGFEERKNKSDSRIVGLSLGNNLDQIMCSLILNSHQRPYQVYSGESSKDCQIVLHDNTLSEAEKTKLQETSITLLDLELWKTENISYEMYPMNHLHHWLNQE